MPDAATPAGPSHSRPLLAKVGKAPTCCWSCIAHLSDTKCPLATDSSAPCVHRDWTQWKREGGGCQESSQTLERRLATASIQNAERGRFSSGLVPLLCIRREHPLHHMLPCTDRCSGSTSCSRAFEPEHLSIAKVSSGSIIAGNTRAPAMVLTQQQQSYLLIASSAGRPLRAVARAAKCLSPSLHLSG